jgi:hypothetical protein
VSLQSRHRSELANFEVNPKFEFQDVHPKIRSVSLTGVNLIGSLVRKFVSRDVVIEGTTVFHI